MASLSLASSCFSTVSTLHGVFKGNSTISCTASTTFLSVGIKKKTNFYKVLSLESESVGVDEIKKAYRSMARRYHPDVCPPSMKEEFTRLFVQVHQAYETLSNPALRALYDMELRVNETAAAPEFWRERWEAQLCELRLRSDRRQREMAGFQRS